MAPAARDELEPPPGVKPLVVDLPVRFSDIDGMGHVNNARFHSYTEEARTLWARRDLKAKDPKELAFILAHARIDFRAPANLDDVVRVEMWVPRIGTKSWDFAYRMTEQGSGRLLATCVTTQAAYDYAKEQAIAIPPAMLKAIRAYAAAP